MTTTIPPAETIAGAVRRSAVPIGSGVSFASSSR